MKHVRHFIGLGALAAAFFANATARATVPVSIDIDYALPVDAGPVGDGFGAALRFGPQLDLALLKLTAEAGLGAHGFSGPIGPVFYRGVIGTRFALGFLLRPSVYGHLGVGHADFFDSSDLTHLTFDVGGALDLTLAPMFEIGAHASYDFLFGNGSVGSFGFLAIGGHFTVILDRKPEAQ